MHPRNFHAPGGRVTDESAYAEHERVRVDVELLGADSHAFVANVGVGVTAIRDRLDVSVNLAHAAIGVVSLESKFTIVDRYRGALGGRVGLTYVNPSAFYFLPPELREQLGGFNLVSAPIELWATIPAARWLGVNLGLGYRQAALWGEIDGDDLFLDSFLARRALVISPYLNFYIAGRVALIVGARLPALSQVASIIDTTVTVNPDLMVGLRSVEWVNRSFTGRARYELALETRFGASTHLRLAVNVGAFAPIGALLVTPSLSAYWRFR